MPKMVNELKENLRNELREKMQNIKENFSKEIDILKKSEVLEMQNSIN